jgi:HK97 family phage major capsid protein
MNTLKLAARAGGYLQANRTKLGMAIAIALGSLAFPAVAAVAPALLIGDTTFAELEKAVKDGVKKMQDEVKKAQDLATNAIEEVKREGSIFTKTNEALTKQGEASAAAQKEVMEKFNELMKRVQDMEQKADKRPGSGAAEEFKTAGQIFADSKELKEMMTSGGWNCRNVTVTRKAAILTPEPVSNDQPLVAAQRLPGIIMAPERRLYIRDLLPQIPTTSNLVEFASELLFTNAAAPQYDASSPSAVRDGAPKPESSITFQLANTPVITIAHYIPASRQMLSDVTQLRGYIDARLTYGLKLEEEDELLNAAGTAGKLNGLRNQATAFAGGATNQSIIDTILRAFTQISMSEYEANGIVLHPLDWQEVLLKKDNDGRYLFADPHGITAPRIWGKPVVSTQSMTQGQFLAGAFNLAAAIFDREDVTIRTADQHLDWFTRNLIAILCEERLALAVFRAAGLVKGSLATPG